MAQFHRAVESLSEQQKRCLFLRMEGLRYPEIGAAMGISASAVGEFLRRAMLRLKKVRDDRFRNHPEQSLLLRYIDGELARPQIALSAASPGSLRGMPHGSGRIAGNGGRLRALPQTVFGRSVARAAAGMAGYLPGIRPHRRCRIDSAAALFFPWRWGLAAATARSAVGAGRLHLQLRERFILARTPLTRI